jgi:hypothetical protein
VAPIAGLLIEYLVVGAVAGLWAAPLAISVIASHTQFQKDLVSVMLASIIPALYLVGMMCDFIGYWLTLPLKKLIERKERGKYAKHSAQKIHAFAVAYEPRLAKEINIRSARDRITRGSLAAVAPLLVYRPYSFSRHEVTSILALIGIVILAMLWYRMQKLSASYERYVLEALLTKHGPALAASFPLETDKCK